MSGEKLKKLLDWTFKLLLHCKETAEFVNKQLINVNKQLKM